MVGPLLPCLALLGLLALKPNRTAGAWWIWAAVAGGYVFQGFVRLYGSAYAGLPANDLADALKAVNLGVGAVWLLAGYFHCRHWILNWLAMLGVMAGFSLGTCWIWQSSAGSPAIIVSFILVALEVLMVAIALGLTGIASRRYGPVRVVAWSVPASLMATVVVLAPLIVFSILANPGRLPIKEFALGGGCLAFMTLGMVLVYVVLSCRTTFYRQRLIALLHLGSQEVPPVITPEPAVEEMAGAN